MILNEAGEMVKRVWRDLPMKYSGIEIDEYIVMPNHIHGIIIVGQTPRVCPDINAVCPDIMDIDGQLQGVAPTKKLSLGDVVQRFKSFVTSQYRLSVERHNWVRFNGKLWQRNYYEHVIRNETDLNKIREYIISNPLNWETDENYL
jgi:REP element-mobilizing transposase RayT